jgi:NADH dehydrogenase
MDVAVSSLADARGVRASLVGVQTVIHLAGREHTDVAWRDLAADVEGTRNLAEACADARVSRVVFLSHLGAELNSAYPGLRAKALAEEHVRRSGVPFTVVRSALAYGQGDWFTRSLAMILAMVPVLFPMPGDGSSVIQPIWIEDLAHCLTWLLDDPGTIRQTYNLGGPEHLAFRDVVNLVMGAVGKRRYLASVRQPYLYGMSQVLARLLPVWPVTPFWIDYLAAHRTTDLDTAPRVFGLKPSRLEHRLDHLRGVRWWLEFIRLQRAAR